MPIIIYKEAKTKAADKCPRLYHHVTVTYELFASAQLLIPQGNVAPGQSTDSVIL
jgi:hypothetical protein